MNQEIKNSTIIKTKKQNNGLKDLLFNYLQYWKWFLLGIVISMVAAFLYLRYQVPKYEAKASILIKDDKNGGVINELSAFKDLGLLKGGSNIDNEIEVLKSRTLMENVVNELELNIEYFINTGPTEKELFLNKPIKLSCLKYDSCFFDLDTCFIVSVCNNKNYKLLTLDGEETGAYKFGEAVKTTFGKINILLTDSIYSTNPMDIKVKFSPVNKSVDRYNTAIIINPINKSSDVILISLTDPNKEKAMAVINNLIKQHNLDAINDKNQISENTSVFINQRIQLITKELSEVESDAELFKTKHKLVDVESEAGLYLNTGAENEKYLIQAKTELQIADYMIDYIKDQKSENQLIPVNLGISDISITELINNFNKIILERNKLIKNSGEKNSLVLNLESQIINLRKSLYESLINLKNALNIKCKDLSRQEQSINSKIADVPKYEKEYRIIQRQQQIKEALYLYLLQKREETNIALAVTVANSKIVNKAYSTGITISPKKRVIYSVFFLFGILVPVGGIYLIDLFDSKVRTKKDLEILPIAYLGDIPLTVTKEKMIVTGENRTAIGESFRSLRTNVDFMLHGVNSKCKTIFITSTIEKEGKSFIALNLAASFALLEKKVLLMGLDLRAPKILEYLEMKGQTGVTNWMTNEGVDLDSLIFKAPNNKNLFILPSGTIPPNPSELLMTNKMAELFEDVKQKFDYVIVDTAPIGMVTDTLLVSKFADCCVYIIKAKYLEKDMLCVLEDAVNENRLPKVGMVLNGAENNGINGYGYGYGVYGKEKKRKLLDGLKLNS